MVHIRGKPSRASNSRAFRMRYTRIKFVFALFLLLALSVLYQGSTWLCLRSHLGFDLDAHQPREHPSKHLPEQKDTKSRLRPGRFFVSKEKRPAKGRKASRLKTTTTRAGNGGKGFVWRHPLVDRTILNRLDRMQAFFAQDDEDIGIAAFSGATASADESQRFPPRVTRIPERPTAPKTTSKPSGICESPTHPRPCRFLLPLRISEQESKARIHFSQIAHLSRELNRTLVLPNVGKSKIGACFRWKFGLYYDLQSFAAITGDQSDIVDMDDFRAWIDSGRRPTSQLVAVGPSLPDPDDSSLPDEEVVTNTDVVVRRYAADERWKKNLPGCFSSRFENLALETYPVFISASESATNEDESILPIGVSILDAFSRITSPGMAGNDADVLVVNWDLRYPVFPASSTGQQLQYSDRMTTLASRIAPSSPYLVIQWRMETVNPYLLEDCAHALVDVVARLLHDETLSSNISTVWFASDYPYPIAPRTKMQNPPAALAKSGTFKNFETMHEEAVEVLRKAFVESGELGSWRLTDIAEAIDEQTNDLELLQDSGVLGILDKLISVDAGLFVSGSSRCSRKSSFTRQVVSGRLERRQNQESNLGNIVDVFG